ncbi:hypothetical protein QBC32DRAFT_408013 [Pseudoneurospora amorphoporcata]|uniref:CFEM domain-containing protein n=1 Tax=Pseudoneurospora amorphoporcata TaxID=241081 RepID=A0AAN6SD58_9PEZI|nr:hypothetical protein QBC32DRAFT_408013 [Pseudoneurospora amorphoporcata]
MKFSTIPVAGALFLARVNAQLSGCTAVAVKVIPSCAQTCFIDNAPSVGCDGFDFACQCQKQAAFFAAIESCVANSCAASEFQNVIDGAAKVCACALPANSPQTVSGTVVPPAGTVIGTVIPPPAIPTSHTVDIPAQPAPTTIVTSIPSSIASAYPTDDGHYSGTWIPTASEVPAASSTGAVPPVVTAGAGRSAQIGLGAGIAVALALL